MKIHILPKTGIKDAEKYALQCMEAEFPRQWRGYASFEIVDKKILNREIDLIILTNDRVLVIELKRWNGHIESIDGYWYKNGNRMGPSPVTMTGEKCRILKKYIERSVEDGTTMHVDYRVVLCGNSPRPSFTEVERPFVLQLDEFLHIKEERAYKQLLPQKAWAGSPLKHLSAFDSLFRNASFFKPTEFSFQNYRVEEGTTAIFEHPAGLYREYKAVNRSDSNAKALLRRWQFGSLGTAAPTQLEWVNIAQRESRLHAFVKSRTDELEGTLLQPIAVTADEEVTSEHCELFDLPIKQKRLFEFRQLYKNELSLADRIALVKVLISRFAILHKLGIAHRDIGDHCIWLERPQSIRLSGFVAAYFPQMETLGPLREKISAVTTKLPEDVSVDEHATPFHRDVFLLGVVSHILIFGDTPQVESELPMWAPHDKDPLNGQLDNWFARALDWAAKNRFADAREMLDEINQLDVGNEGPSIVPLSAFDFFQASTKVQDYEQLEDPVERGDAEVFKAKYAQQVCLVKVWYGLRPDAAKAELNLSLLRFFEKARAIQANPCVWLPEILDAGLTKRGLLFVRKWIEGQTLEAWLASDCGMESRVRLSINLIEGIQRLHGLPLQHGDIHPKNILICSPAGENGSPIAVFIDTPDLKFGESSVHNTAYAPPNYQHISTEERDRFAVTAVVADLLRTSRDTARDGEYPLPDVYEELARCFEAKPSILTLEPLAEALINSLRPTAPAPRQVVVTLARMPDTLKVGELLSDNGVFYVQARPKGDNFVQVFVVGPRAQLNITINRDTHDVRQLNLDPVVYAQFMHSTRPGASYSLASTIVVRVGTTNDAKDLIDLLLEIPGLLTQQVEVLEEDEEAAEVLEEALGEQPKQRTSIPIDSIWRNLIEAEEDALLEVVVNGDARPHPTRTDVLQIPYLCEHSVLDYEADEEVEVYQTLFDGEKRKVAIMDHRATNAEVVGLRERRGSLSTALGARMFFQSRRDRSSFERRQNAVNRILKGSAVIPNLVRYFDKASESEGVSKWDAPTNGELADYDIFEADGKRVFSLNEDQKNALKQLYTYGPVGLLQGPPGTGKTDFIAAFLHYVISKKGAQHILLVSQTHQATNNALERVQDLAVRTGIPLDVVRVGKESDLSEAIQHQGVSAIQEAYRERFRSELKHRLCTLSRRLLLPEEFVSEYCDAMIDLQRLGEEIQRIEKDLASEADEEELQRLRVSFNGRTEVFWNIASGKYHLPRLNTIVEAIAEVRNRLVRRYDLRSPDSIERLEKLVRISREWIEVLASESGNFAEFLAKTRTIVAGTCVGVGRWNLGVAYNTYDWVVIDEAARAGPSELAVAMQVGRRILLVGDHFQLPPYFKDVLRGAVGRRLGVGLDSDVFDSDFERAFESPYGKLVGATLLTQYRMAPVIGHLVSKCFYEPRGKLLKNGRPAPLELFGLLPDLLRAQVIWADTSKAGQEATERRAQHGKQTWNPFEARVVVDVLRHILTNNSFVDALASTTKEGEVPIGVIATYKAQVAEIERALAKAEWMGDLRYMVKVATVDRYQGKENRIVLLSLTRSNAAREEGFLRSPNRLNVAMSRAMDRLIIIGGTHMWREANQASPLGTVVRHITENAVEGEMEIFDARQFRS